jgi:Domain of Unknown Function (DUF748)
MSSTQHVSDSPGASRPALVNIVLSFAKAHVIVLGIVLALVLIYAIAGFFVVPRVARSQIESFVTGTLHKKIRLGDIRFNPFFLDLSVAGMKLTEPDDKPLVSFRHLYVNATITSLWQRGVVLQEVELSAPDIQVVVSHDGSVNLASLVPPPTEPPKPQEEPPPRVRIGRLYVTDGRVGLEDYIHRRPFTAAITPIRFTLNDFRTDVGYENAYRFAGTTTAGEYLDWSGGFTVQPLGSAGRFSVQGLKLATIGSYLEESLPFRIAGEATLDGHYDLQLDPLALEVTLPAIAVRDATVAERKSSGPPPITLPAIDLHQLAYSYTKRDVGVQDIQIRGARVSVARESDGSISLMRLFGATAAAKPADSGAAPASSAGTAGTEPASTTTRPAESSGSDSDFTVHVSSIRVGDASVVADDRAVTPAAHVELSPVAVTVKGWSTDPKAKLGVEADVRIVKSGRLVSHGEVQLEPLTAALAVDISDVELPVAQPYVAQFASLTLHSGRLSAKGDVDYAGTPEAAPPLKFSGDVQVADLRTTDPLKEDFVKWRDLAVTGISFQQNPDKLTIERIVARQPYAKVVIAPDKTVNVAKVLSPAGSQPAADNDEESGDEQTADTDKEKEKSSDKDSRKKESRKDQKKDKSKSEVDSPPPATATASASASASASGPTMPIRIRTVQVVDGSANFADYSIQPNFATGILELNGKVTGLSSDPASRAQVQLQGKVDKYAPVDIAGEANFLAPAKYAQIAMNFRNMELTTFNPYSGKFAGYNISRGKLSTELKYHVEDRKLQAEHHIVVDNLEFGAKTDSKDAAPIPIKLAVALLKDRNGVIDVQLPVSGTIDDPKFRLGPIIWKAVLGLLTKIVTAPFAALGALFGGGEELAYIDFAPGSAVLAPTETDKLNKLSKALVERPQLRLNVPLSVVGAQDAKLLAQQALDAQVPGLSEPPANDADRRKRIKALEGVYQNVLKAPPQYPPELHVNEKSKDQPPDLDGQIDYLQRTILEKMQPDQAALDALGQQRARAVQDALLANTELNAERVFITSERADVKADALQVRMEMKLE